MSFHPHAPTLPRSHARKRILFLCTGNSCRSQMAEGWARSLLEDMVEVYSAGTAPVGIDPRAVIVMAEAGVDISGHTSNHVDEYRDIPFDLVVTVCDSARETCPVFPGTGETVHRSFDDPPRLAREAGDARDENSALNPYRRVRDEIGEFISGLPSILVLDHSP